MSSYDVILVGSGPGGYVAAIRAAQLGLRVALVEKQHLGGVCLNWGCIPTKALLQSAEMAHVFNNATSFGFDIGVPKINLKAMVDRSRAVANQLSTGIKHLLKKNKVTVIEGTARLKGAGTVVVGKEAYQAKHIILATGARPRAISPVEPDGHLIWTSREAMIPESLPSSLLIVGSGAIGIEFASFYGALGVDITVVELQSRILPQEDEEISTLAQKAFEKKGLKFLLTSQITGIKKHKDQVEATLKTPKGEQTLKANRIISAVGVIGNTEDLGLETTKVRVEKGQIVVDEWCQTDEPGVWAIGDVASPPWLAHKASHEGILCVEKIAGLTGHPPLDRTSIPACTYSHPQIASIGLTEEKAKSAGHDIKVGRFPYRGNGKALAIQESEGLVKTIFDAKTGQLLGAHLIGHDATELIQGFSIAKTLETTEVELMRTIFPHPTLSEMIHESVLDAYGRAIHF